MLNIFRPKDRKKNIIIGRKGSGMVRSYIKPITSEKESILAKNGGGMSFLNLANLLKTNSDYIVTDVKTEIHAPVGYELEYIDKNTVKLKKVPGER